ncbi:MAG: putative bifunctional cbb3-type cytochrome c oxidase subunit II/cytochrome c [Candidatus Accumulibacter appositus]|uniref:Putative bifunctional cbb3-type cytochrome c oxidase subunit II/cytochrome c n=1 Tax=Candidatus Accumulibacter appositus TaxID=1454003 RepID=A0A011P5I6_9PROT|nr:cytochrome c [Accumulibacter sp.]EXI82851.1 MAG: putative bifunctional cbb3-type cytochrome c oxidase subunit II/cytochrome c [Candidatus Accumulibacter appositus]HRF05102.1 cytochrome c [Accumulibacter sp.]
MPALPALALLLLVAAPLAIAEPVPPVAAPSPERQRALVHLVRQDCGSCHGMTLQGGLGPALTPAALRERPADSLVATIYGGRPGTPMPPWHRFLSEAEATWIVQQLLLGFPEE